MSNTDRWEVVGVRRGRYLYNYLGKYIHKLPLGIYQLFICVEDLPLGMDEPTKTLDSGYLSWHIKIDQSRSCKYVLQLSSNETGTLYPRQQDTAPFHREKKQPIMNICRWETINYF